MGLIYPKYIVRLDWDEREGEVGSLIDIFQHPDDQRVMYTIEFNDGQLKGYYDGEIEPMLKLLKKPKESIISFD
jgi:hypothetical protein